MCVICLFFLQKWKTECLFAVLGSLHAFDAMSVYLFSYRYVVDAIFGRWPTLADVKLFCWSMFLLLVVGHFTRPKLRESKWSCTYKHKMYLKIRNRTRSKSNDCHAIFQCFLTSWYISMDLQLFIVAPAIVFLIHRSRVKTLIALFAVVLICVGCTIAAHANYNLRNMYVYYILYIFYRAKFQISKNSTIEGHWTYVRILIYALPKWDLIIKAFENF